MTDLLTQPAPFLVAGICILLVGTYVLARAVSARRRLSYFQLSLTAGLWVIVYGTLVRPDADPAALRTSGDLFVFLGLLVGLTVYQFTTYGLGFGSTPAGDRRRKRGLIAMWGIVAAVAILVSSGGMELMRGTGGDVTAPSPRLDWRAIPVVIATWAGVLGALHAAGRTWVESPPAARSGQAAWAAAAAVVLLVVPLALHTSLLGTWGSGTAGLATLVGAGIMGGVATMEPPRSLAVDPHVDAALRSLRGPALAIGRDATIRSANEPFLERFGYEDRQLKGRHLDELVADESGSHLPLSSLSLDLRGAGREVRVRARGGPARPARAVASQLGHVDGEELPHLFLFVPEFQVAGAGREEGALDRWLREGFRPEAPAVALCDPGDGTFTGVNDQFLQLVGYARQDVLGRSASELQLPVYANRWADFLRRIRDAGAAGEMEVEVQRGGGEVQHAEFRGVAVPSGTGREALILARDLTARKEAEEKLRGEVLYDPLTGLPNRVLFKEQLNIALKRAQRYRHRVAVLFVDLNGFKEVNDSHGHAAGDQLLAAVAWRLYECFRQMDTLCRYGGDEFLVLLEDLEEPRGAAAAADRFRRSLEAPFRLGDGTEVRVGATIGAAVSVPGQSEGEDLIQWADMAMYRAKRRGASPIRVYDPERDAGERERLSQVDELRKAIERRELALVYQPLIALDEDDRVIGAEALVRWPQPSGEVRSPGEFLPLAEESGLIVPMSEWIFEEAARKAKAWRSLVPDFKMSVNVAAQHFRDPSLVETLETILAEVGLPPEGLQLEITESAALRDARAIDRLREHGLRVAADDFGTGYSSLEYIRELSVDGVKIDRAFVGPLGEDPKDQAIVRAMLLMAEAFSLEVTAEGIETEYQLRWLREAGCQLGQGYYFARPMPPEDFEELLRSG